ncbi:MAG TPA: TonB family protein [Syntrophorhabdaceae bacterium]|nr:TonB family protein [Syntrophorhabdaceae bacterium]
MISVRLQQGRISRNIAPYALLVLALLASCASTDTRSTHQAVWDVTGAGGPSALSDEQKEYLIGVKDALYASWHCPEEFRSDSSLSMLVVLKASKDGKVLDVTVDKRSGNNKFDESVLTAIQTARGLPSIPASLNADAAKIAFAFKAKTP